MSGVVGTVESLSEMARQLAQFAAKRPVWIEQVAAHYLAPAAARTAPLWRWVRIAGPLGNVAVRGTSIVATVGGAGGLALTAGVPIVVAAGVWVMLGSGYAEARRIAKKRGLLNGFSQGFTMGILKWEWHHVDRLFVLRFVVKRNAWDPVVDREETVGFNEGLLAGFAAGRATSEETKKALRIELRRLASRHGSRDWSRNDDEARLQQRNYVIELAGAGVRSGLIVAE